MRALLGALGGSSQPERVNRGALFVSDTHTQLYNVVTHGLERLRLENRFYTTPLFRKCHLELATGGAGLSVLHCVMYPWPAHDLPLFSVDMVGFGVRRTPPLARAATPDATPRAPQPRVTLAIADVCPSREDLSLPRSYAVRGAGRSAPAAALTASLARRALATSPHACAA
jgi:hypothetical protein